MQVLRVSPMVIMGGVALFFMMGCNPARHATRLAQERQFYDGHSRVLGFELTGKEDPLLIGEVASWMGTPYYYGGTNRGGADCSGFALSVYQQVYGYKLPRNTVEMARHTSRVGKRRLKEGNLVFFRTKSRTISHVGIYLGKGYFIHVSTSRGVMVNHLDEPYYARTFAYGGRMRR